MTGTCPNRTLFHLLSQAQFYSAKMLSTYIVLMIMSVTALAATDKMVCYFGSWAGYRLGNGKYDVESIQPQLCTHIIYSFVGITTSGDVKILDTWNDLPTGKDGYNRFLKLKSQSAGTKFLVAIGGWNEGSYSYSVVMNNPTTRATFVQNVVRFVKQYGFDGFDLDWEYPAQRGGAATDKAAFVSLVRELRTEFDKDGLLLTAAVGAGTYLVQSSYDLPQISKYLHFINLMTYDYHGSYDRVTGHNAPLYPGSADTSEFARQLNINATVNYWIQNGADRSKIILGIGTYGQSYTLSSTANAGVGAPCSGPGNSGPYTLQPGMLGYNEICEKIKNGGWSVKWDDQQKVPYAVNGNQWVGFDNIESVQIKAQFARDMGLGGAMIWSLETDDFRGSCTGTKYPLLTAINEIIRGGGVSNNGGTVSSSGTDAPAPTTQQTTTTTTSSNNSGSVCTKEGYVRDPLNCQVFYLCQLVNGAFVSYKYQCYGDLVFDSNSQACNYRSMVAC